SGVAWPPATQIRSWKTKAECSCRAFQTTPERSSFQSLPSREYQTSPQFFDGLFDQPPSTHIRPRYTTAENQIRGGHGALPVTRSHLTPSAEHQTSLIASYFGW